MKKFRFFWFWLIAMGCSLQGAMYHSVKVSELDFGENALAAKEALDLGVSVRTPPTVRCLEECYIAFPMPEGGNRWGGKQADYELVFHLEDEETVRGFIDLRSNRGGRQISALKGFPFTFTPGKETVSTAERFNEIREFHYRDLSSRHLPGTAWFRHLAGSHKPGDNNRNWRRASLSDSFGIFSGGRAISENLALDRELILSAGEDDKTVSLSEIKGITVPAIDWSSRLPEGEVLVDALSLSIPEDQHAVFTKSLPELLALIRRAETQLIPSTQEYSVRSPFRTLAKRYRAQMGLDVPAVAARLLPAKSVAITGGDPFYPQGTDIAFVMASDTPELLYKALLTRIKGKASEAGATATKLQGKGFQYAGFETADRKFSSHVWQMDGVVAVSNSKMQIRSLIEVAKKEKTALGATDEYRFFRNRYPLADEESAFIFLSDATIRRWAGPELRVAASRRTRALAAIGKLTSQAIAEEQLSDDYIPLLGKAEWKDGRILSPVFGSVGFMTPSSELTIKSATVPEKEAYERWRNGYENGWAQAFDPIAIRILSKDDSIEFDLSVIPLAVDSDFSDFVRLCGEAELSDLARWVPGESVFHAAIALDTKGEEFRKYDSEIGQFLPNIDLSPLGWMTGSVSMDLERSLFWKAGSEADFDRFLKAPVVIRIGSNSRLKLALFMTAMKNAVDTSAPDSVTWETRKSDGTSYVVITGNEMGSDFHIYYATMPNALIVTLREESLLRAIRREKHKLSGEEKEALSAPTQLMLDSSPEFLSGLTGFFDSTGTLERLQEESWKALPVLNEWHHRFMDEDPVKIQLTHFGEDIFCPGAKGYRWNSEAMTMESVAFGYPSEPKAEPAKMHTIMDFDNVATSLKFQDEGLRAGLFLGKQPKRVAPTRMKVPDGEMLGTAREFNPVKEGMILTYKGIEFGSPATSKLTTQNVVEEGEKLTFDIVSETDPGEGEPFSFTASYRLDKGLFLDSDSYENGKTLYSIPCMELPEKLISGEVIGGVSKGIEEWRNDDGIVIREKYQSNFEIRIIGKEDVEVPAGKFPGCLRVEFFDEFLRGNYFGSEKCIIWYHPQVGMLKYEYREGQDSRMELQKISIPSEE